MRFASQLLSLTLIRVILAVMFLNNFLGEHAYALKIDKYDLGKTKCPFSTSGKTAINTFLYDFERHLNTLGMLDEDLPSLEDGPGRPACSGSFSYSPEFVKKTKAYCKLPNKFFYSEDVTCEGGVVVAYSKMIAGSSATEVTKALSEKYDAKFESPKAFSEPYTNLTLVYGTNGKVGFMVRGNEYGSKVIYFTMTALDKVKQNVHYQNVEQKKLEVAKPSLKDSI